MQFGAQECVRHWGRYRPKDTAIQTESESISYGEFDRRVDALASLIEARAEGARVGILCRSKTLCLLAFLAANRSGRSAITFHLGSAASELEDCISDTQPGLIITDKAGQRSISKVVCSCPVVLYGDGDGTGGLPIGSHENESGDECCVLFSSGTTGRSKGIERDNYSMVTESIGWCLELALNRHTKFYVGRPIFYTGGLVLSLAMLTVGGTLVYADGIDDNDFRNAWDAFLRMSGRYDLDWGFFIPDQLRAFVARIGKQMGQRPLLRQILTMGAPISGEEKLGVSGALDCEVIEFWGNSESLGTITDVEDLVARSDSIGRPFLTDELYIVNDEGMKLGPNEIGRIAGDVEAGFTRYSAQEEATKATIVNGMIISDDVGKFDDSGRFYVLGRVADRFDVGGRSLTTSMVEARIRATYPNSPFCIVVLIGNGEHPELGLVVEEAASDSVAVMRGLIADECGAVVRVRDLVVDALPRLGTGKIDRVTAAELLKRA